MRTATSRIDAGIGVVALMASVALVGIATTPATAAAEPATHQVRYTLTSAGSADFDLYYVTAQPPSKAAYDADAYSFLKKDQISLAPGVPWVFDTTLADPNWAILTVSSTTHGLQAAPNPHCEISVDGQLVVQQDAPYNLQCKLPGSVI